MGARSWHSDTLRPECVPGPCHRSQRGLWSCPRRDTAGVMPSTDPQQCLGPDAPPPGPPCTLQSQLPTGHKRLGRNAS